MCARPRTMNSTLWPQDVDAAVTMMAVAVVEITTTMTTMAVAVEGTKQNINIMAADAAAKNKKSRFTNKPAFLLSPRPTAPKNRIDLVLQCKELS